MRAPKEIKNCRNRQIIYEIESWGANVRFNEKNNNYTLNVEGTKNNKVFLLVRYKDVMADPKLSFFTETGGVVDSETNMDRTKGYVLLATIQSEPVLRQHNTMICHDDILIAKKFLRNQTQTSKRITTMGPLAIFMALGMDLYILLILQQNIQWRSLLKVSYLSH